MMSVVASESVVISTTGLISREIFERFDSDRNFYVPGSMGLASSIGLGLAVSCPKERIVVIDGDASLLMNLGSMVTIGNRHPVNLLHIVIDNGAYGSCSEEKSMSDSAHLDKLAINVGYKKTYIVENEKNLKDAILESGDGPVFVLAKIELGGRRDFKRPLKLPELKERLMKSLERDKEKNHDV